jgi:hypothetical protein
MAVASCSGTLWAPGVMSAAKLSIHEHGQRGQKGSSGILAAGRFVEVAQRDEAQRDNRQPAGPTVEAEYCSTIRAGGRRPPGRENPS